MVNTSGGHTILCTWEIGSELGHISRFSAIVRALESQNYNVVVVLKDLSRAYPFFVGTKAVLMQAPVWLPKMNMQRPIACLADSLLLLGYLETDALHSLVMAWDSIIELVQPDLVIFDYAPTAMLSLIGASIPKILVGSGFADPVPKNQIVDWRPYPTKDQLIQRQENRVLEQINNVLARKNTKPLGKLSDLFLVDQTIITTFPELDLYNGLRKHVEYCVGSSLVSTNKKVKFPRAEKQKIIAYLKPSYPHLLWLLESLSLCDADVFVSCPQGNSQDLQKFISDSSSEKFQFSIELVNLEEAMQVADLFVGHGNAGTLRESLTAGTPVAVLPIQLEQLLNGQLVQKNGFGRLVEKIDSVREMTAILNQMLKDKEVYQKEITALLSRYPKSSRVSTSDAVARCVKELLFN